MSEFTDTIAAMWPNYIIAPGAAPEQDCCGNLPEDDEAAYELANEPSFSWQPCESCGSTLGGHRYAAHAIHREAFGPDAARPDDVHHIEICTDCLVWHANGDEPENRGNE